MDKIFGVVVGLVLDVNDPMNIGRVRVGFPFLSDDNSSQWARIATLMAGPQRGSWFMPEPGDEALVAFEHGDVQHPYVVGFLWNGEDTPPNDESSTSVRRLKTVAGHVLEFDDRPGKERILIETKAGHQIEMKDEDENIIIRSKGDHKIEISDKKNSIDVQTTGGQKFEIDDKTRTITFSTTGGILNVNCLMANITATSLISLTAPMVIFSGVIQAPTVIAGAVVGSAYTPAPGNFFGL